MASPAIAATATTDGSGATASAVVNLPTGIVAGNLLLVLHRSAVGTAAHAVSGGGWTNLFNDASDASDDRTSLWYRQADGTEGATITITQTSSKFASLAWRITGHENPATQAPQFATLATGTSAAPDPGSLSPTGGAKDYLWLWMGGWEGEQTSPPASNPTNYTANIIGANSGVGGAIATNCRTASASRQLNAASEDPGSWTISVSDDWTATVVAVHPASAQPALLEAAVTATATIAAALTTAIELLASVSGLASIAAALTTAITLAASPLATASVAADLNTEIRMAAAATGTATVSAELTAPQQVLLEVSLSGSATTTPALTTEITLAAAPTGTALAVAELTTAIALAATPTGTASLTASLTTEIVLEAILSGEATAVGALSTEITAAAALTGSGTVVADVTVGTPAAELAAVLMASAAVNAALTAVIAPPPVPVAVGVGVAVPRQKLLRWLFAVRSRGIWLASPLAPPRFSGVGTVSLPPRPPTAIAGRAELMRGPLRPILVGAGTVDNWLAQARREDRELEAEMLGVDVRELEMTPQ